MAAVILQSGELADFSDYVSFFERIGTGYYTDRLKRFFEDWYPGANIIPWASDNMESVMTYFIDFDETVGANLMTLFESAPDADAAEKSVVAIRGAATVLGAILTSEFAQKVFEGMLINVGIPPQAIAPAFDVAQAEMNKYWTPSGGYGDYDLEAAEAMKTGGRAAWEELGQERVAEYVKNMELADVAPPRTPHVLSHEKKPSYLTAESQEPTLSPSLGTLGTVGGLSSVRSGSGSVLPIFLLGALLLYARSR